MMPNNLQAKSSKRRNKNRKTFAFKMSVMSILLVSLCVGIVSAFAFFSYRSSVIELFGTKAGYIAFSVASTIEPEMLIASAETGEYEFWHYVQETLDDILGNVTDLTFLYVMMPYDDERFIYFASAGWPELHGVVEVPEVYGPEPWQAMQEGRIATTGIADAGDWGILIGGFAPIYDAYGRVFAVVGADVDVTYVDAQVFIFARNALLIGLIAAILTGGIIRIFTIRTLSKSLKRIVEIDLSSSYDTANFRARESDANAKDEIGVLYEHFSKMLETIHTLQTDMSAMLNKHISGQYEHRLDVSKYKGEQQKLAMGANALVDMYVSNFIELLEVFKQYGQGNFSANVSTYAEDWRWANEIVDDLRKGFIHLTSEIGKLAENATKGEFSVLANSGSQQGEWVQLIDSLNRLLASVAEPLADIERNVIIMSKGNFSHMEGEYHGKFGTLQEAYNLVNNTTGTYINEISQTLQSIASGDLTITIKEKYVGSYAPIEASINAILINLRQIMSDIQDAVDKVAFGAEQISENAMNLAEGATRQTAAIEELSSSVMLIHEKAMQASNDAISASKNSTLTQEHVAAGGKVVKLMAETMHKIKASSESIGKIIDVITSIAFQTNLLALNASVEAARAGEHGKGFSVVADEVRNLAARSQGSASETSSIIDEDVKHVEEGLRATDDVVTSFEIISNNIAEISDLISDIAEISGEQLDSISSINARVSEITGIVTDTTATAEESASASQELSSQAEQLRQKVAFFKIGGN